MPREPIRWSSVTTARLKNSAPAPGTHAIGNPTGGATASRSSHNGGSEALHLGNLKAWGRGAWFNGYLPPVVEARTDVLGEGGAMLIRSRRRGGAGGPSLARWSFRVSAIESNNAAIGEGEAVRQAALEMADGPEQVGTSAHGTATQANDPMETQAIRKVFGKQTDRIAVSSTKSLHGHALGAAGALEAAATVLGLRHKMLPPTANFEERDPECDLDVVANGPREAEVEVAVSNSVAFGDDAVPDLSLAA